MKPRSPSAPVATRAFPRWMHHRRFLAGLAVLVLPLLHREPALGAPRIELVPEAPELLESRHDPFVTVRLVDCPTRSPVGSLDVRVLATPGTATEGVDFFAFGRVRLGALDGDGQRTIRSAEIPLEVVHDEETEPPEDFFLRAELEPGASIDCGHGAAIPEVAPPVRLRIVDVVQDLSVVSFVDDSVHMTEGDGDEPRFARLAVSRREGRMPVSVACQTTRAGSAVEREDFDPVAVVLGWGENDQEDKWCEVPIRGDDLAEAPETVTLALVPLVGSLEIRTSKATVHVRDDDAPGRVQFTAVRFTAKESDAAAVVGLERKWGSEGASSVRVRVTPRGARAGEDYRVEDTIVTWDPGDQGNRELRIALVDDEEPEPLESLVLRLESVDEETLLGDLVDAIVQIEDDDAIRLGEDARSTADPGVGE